jgi:hypothetical protein
MLFVAGSGHTGSTLLALVLDSHPEIACIGESSIKPKIVKRGAASVQTCSCGSRVAECPFWTQVFDLVRREGHDFGHDRWANDYRFTRDIPQRLLSRACSSAQGRAFVRWAADHLPAYKDRIRQKDLANLALIRSVLTVSGARVFADTSKRMWRLVHLLRLSELDIRVVLLVRDVRGYAASAKRRQGIAVADSARTWLRDQRAMAETARALPSSHVHRLRYEDFCLQPEATQRSLWQFCGVSTEPAWTTVLASEHHVLGNNMRLGGAMSIRLDESWRSRLDEREIGTILDIAGDLNRDLGYQ